MTPRSPRTTRLSALAVVLALATAACGSGGGVQPTTTPTTPGGTSSPTPSASPTDPGTATATSTQTDEGGLVLAGQFTAFVGADGQGDACDTDWWAAPPPAGEPFVGLSNTQEVTAPGRAESLCLLGFEGTVELTVTAPDGSVWEGEFDASDSGDVLEVTASAPIPMAQLAAWQSSPGPTTSTEDPTDDITEDQTDDPTEDETEDPTDDATEDPTDDVTDDPTEDTTDPVELDWQVPGDARGDYAFLARQGDRQASATVTVVAPTRLEVGDEVDGWRTITLHDGPGEPVPLGIYRVVGEVGEFAEGNGFWGRTFELVADAGSISDGQSLEVEVGALGPGRYCAISPAVEFADCRPADPTDVFPGASWFQ